MVCSEDEFEVYDEVIVQTPPTLSKSGTGYRRAGNDRRDADFCQFSSDHCRSRGGKKLGGEVNSIKLV